MNKSLKENLIIINGDEYVHCPVCGTITDEIEKVVYRNKKSIDR